MGRIPFELHEPPARDLIRPMITIGGPSRRVQPSDRGDIRVEPWRFKVLYDGECPFCRLEARWLGHLGRTGSLVLEDIATPDFDPSRYGTTLPALMGSLHGVFPDGRQTTGMETFRQAYSAVGLGWIAAPTGWPVLRVFFDLLYRLFARYRVKMGRLFGRSCAGDRCGLPEAGARRRN
jgi:predicted DCC family thiol-disulfide oxidoreductase YuxK